jgi:hypothetical protein
MNGAYGKWLADYVSFTLHALRATLSVALFLDIDKANAKLNPPHL